MWGGLTAENAESAEKRVLTEAGYSIRTAMERATRRSLSRGCRGACPDPVEGPGWYFSSSRLGGAAASRSCVDGEAAVPPHVRNLGRNFIITVAVRTVDKVGRSRSAFVCDFGVTRPASRVVWAIPGVWQSVAQAPLAEVCGVAARMRRTRRSCPTLLLVTLAGGVTARMRLAGTASPHLRAEPDRGRQG